MTARSDARFRTFDEAERLDAYHSILGRWRVLCRSYRRRRMFLWWALWKLGGPIIYVLNTILPRVDLLVHPALRTYKLDRPVFIVAHPRSGTTFLQRHLHRTGQTSMFRTSDLFFVSLVERTLARPVMWFVRRAVHQELGDPQGGHEIRLDGIEEEEGLYMHRVDSQIFNLLCPWLLVDQKTNAFAYRLGSLNRAERLRSVRFYVECLRRNSFADGRKRVVTKCNPNIHRIREIFEVCPDARIIYLVRSPEQAIQSYLSLHRYHLSGRLSDEDAMTYFRQTYRKSVDMYRDFERDRPQIPADQLLVVPFSQLTDDSAVTLRQIVKFTELSPAEAYWKAFAQKRRTEHSVHHRNVPVEEFGITNEEIRRDLKFVYDNYDM